MRTRRMELPFPVMKETVGGVGLGGTIAVTLGVWSLRCLSDIQVAMLTSSWAYKTELGSLSMQFFGILCYIFNYSDR